MILLLIRCNICKAERIGAWKRPHVMRKRLAARGWRHVAAGGKDYCPECVAKTAKGSP
jgi:hypothetical protein